MDIIGNKKNKHFIRRLLGFSQIFPLNFSNLCNLLNLRIIFDKV